MQDVRLRGGWRARGNGAYDAHHRDPDAQRAMLRACVCAAASVLVIAAVLVAEAMPASATTQRTLTLDELVDTSDVIVAGRVIHTEALPHGPNGRPGIHTRVDVAVEDWLLGAAPQSIVTLWVHGGRIEDRMRVVPGQAHFATGEHVLLFLFETEDGELWPNGMAQGKRLLSDGNSVPVGGPTASGSPSLRLVGSSTGSDSLVSEVRHLVRERRR